MCGIFCAFSENDDVACQLHSQLAKLLRNRGPDVSEQLQLDNMLLSGNVLWQQGATPQKQPIVQDQLVLLFNGDLYNLKTQKPAQQADSAWLMQQLVKCEDDKQLLDVLRQLQGPYCLLLYNSASRLLYFCRDALGRNSLLIERADQSLRLLSTSCYATQQLATASLELPPLGLFKLHLAELDTCTLYPWQPLSQDMQQQLQTLDARMRWSTQLGATIAPTWLQQAAANCTAGSYDFYELAAAATTAADELYPLLLGNLELQQTLQRLDKLLQQSVADRVLHTAPICRKCHTSVQCTHAKLCLLFSGGIDCTILALLADKFVPPSEPIELINVAFERVAAAADTMWDVPDRQTARQSLVELQRLCPQRCWQLLEVNVTRAELQQQLSTHICQLIYPLQTVLDESLGCAFWFAAATPQSSARVALLGSGADELFGGYQRHRNAYRRAPSNKLEAVQQELELDWQRIPARNLARDDRVIADTGKTARAPFIEEHVVSFVRSLTPQQRCCYTLPEGVGDKLLLRLYGYSLGLRDAVLLKKRAIQFGSRIADKKQQAAQQSDYLKFGSGAE